MNANAKKWVEALRSGAYKQGRARLKYRNTFCGLGVLCDLAEKAGVPDAWPRVMKTALLPKAVCDWAGLKSSPIMVSVSGYAVLANHNDDGMSFSEIADIIEARASRLFRDEPEERK